MKKTTKIWLAISGILLVVLGVICICNPAETLFASAWIIGLFTLISGFGTLAFTLNTQRFLPNSGTRMLSALMQIFLGFFFLFHNMIVTISLPVVFAIWVMVEGIILAINSFDYKKVGFKYWYCLLILGIAAAVLGCFGLRNLDVAGKTLSTLIGIGVILMGCTRIIALAGINKFERKIDGIKEEIKGIINDIKE